MEKNRDIERLRAFAVLFVVVAHISWIQAAVADAVNLKLLPWTGVDLFFVISGFVVSGAFERDIARFESGSTLPRLKAVLAFATKRAARILPTAFTCIAVWWFGWMYFNEGGYFGPAWSNEQAFSLVAANALFFANYAMVSGLVPDQLGWYWSLCVEEHFYLLYPAFRLTARSTNKRVWVLAGVIVAVVALRSATDSYQAAQKLSHMRFDQIAMGVLLYLGFRRFSHGFEYLRGGLQPWMARAIAATVALGLIVVVAALPTTVATSTFSPETAVTQMRLILIVSGLLSVALVFLASFNLDLLAFGLKPLGSLLVAVGARSYAIYMYHIPAQWFSQELVLRNPHLLSLNHPDRSMITIYLIVMAVMVEANYRLIEQPFVALGKRGVARIAGQPAAPRARLSPLPRLRTAATGLAAIGILSLTGMVALEAGLRATTTPLPIEQVSPIQTSSFVEALRTLRTQGIDAVGPGAWQLVPRTRDLPVIPLASVSRRVALMCEGPEGWLPYHTDIYGFNNPASAHSDIPADYVLLGDEAVACTPAQDSVATLLRSRSAKVLDLTAPGHGPFQSLAALREYGLAAQPRRVIWFVSEATDIADFSADEESQVLTPYLAPGYAQNLRGRQDLIDRLLLSNGRGGPLGIASDYPESRADGRWSAWLTFPAVRQWWTVPDQLDPDVEWFQRGLGQPMFAVRPIDPPIPNQPRFAELIARMRDDAASAGGTLVIVVLPERRRFVDPTYTESHRPQILRLSQAAGVPAIDMIEVFKRAPSPGAMFRGRSTMYSPLATRVIAAAVAVRAAPGLARLE